MRRWLGYVLTGVLLVALLSTAACTRSKLGPAPTSSAASAPPATQAVQTPAAGKTVIALVTVTGTVASNTPMPMPTMTPTVQLTATMTPTPVPTTGPTATPSPNEFTYTVRTGDTLWGLAIRFGTTVEAIKARNGLSSDIIYADDELVIPGTGEDNGGVQAITHIVQPGENLYRIALKYGTTPEAIAAANHIVNPNIIYPGRKLTIYSGQKVPGPGTRYHMVQPGESLWSIALKYGTTPWKIAALNGISNIHYIYAGQTLRIP